MKNCIALFCYLFFWQVSFSQNAHFVPVIPLPFHSTFAAGYFTLHDLNAIVYPVKNAEMKKLAEQFVHWSEATGIKMMASAMPKSTTKKSIILWLKENPDKPEYYKIQISKSGIRVEASQERGIFYALQTLMQMKELGKRDEETGNVLLPYIIIEDEPRFSYRGLHLDVARHFFSIDFIKRYIDLMSRFKYNYFHWHLTDDQGWRIEIKKFPELALKGSIRNSTLIGHYSNRPAVYDSVLYDGYYTQEEIKEVIQYAKERYVEIIPEIEMPGHSSAALAAYPEFGCTGGPYQVANTWGVFNEVFCTKDTTLWFVKEILNEVCDLFPGKYIHVGGDECPKTEWSKCKQCQSVKRRNNLKSDEELQSYFIREVERFVKKKGKRLIGWDEILEGGLAPNATVMSWRGTKGGIEAAKLRHNVIMTPGTHCYFDHYQSASANEPLAIGGHTSLEKVYSFDPIPANLPVENHRYILGSQGNVWTEYMEDENKVIYMTYPRAIALAEVNWSAKNKKSYKDFLGRLLVHYPWFSKNELNIANTIGDLDIRTYSHQGENYLVFVRPPIPGKILLEMEKDGDYIQEYVYEDTFHLNKTIRFKAWYQMKDKSLGKSLSIDYNHHKAAGKSIQLIHAPAEKYFHGGAQSLINGLNAPSTKYGGKEWTGMEGKDFEGIIDFEKPIDLTNVSIQFYHLPGSWIYAPKEIEIYGSNDSNKFELIHSEKYTPGKEAYAEPEFFFKNTEKWRYVKLIIKNYGEIEDGKPGAGHKAWLFVGEIEVH
ncbi:MAG: family 20 glycosylhydrolase [Bacteroidota bacterium]|nr:family 20 glycosylhydrolase [Bacteroidota bacterium]